MINALRKVQVHNVAGAERIYRKDDLRELSLNLRPTGRRQHRNCEGSASQVLLVAQTLVGGDKGIKRGLACFEKVAILKLGPAQFVGGGNGVSRQLATQGFGRSLIEENSHEGSRGGRCGLSRGQARFGVAQNRLGLFALDAGEPL